MYITDINQKLLELIKTNTSNEEICQILKITKKELKNRLHSLRRQGFNIKNIYFYDGMVQSRLQKHIEEEALNIENIPDNIFRAIMISDLHLGSKLDNLDYLYMVYNYCKNNDIHLIFNGGDIIQGTLGPRRIMKIEDQIEYLLKYYPKEDDILNFLVLGNHDADAVRTLGLDLNNIINENREDLISLGYRAKKINIGNSYFALAHEPSDLWDIKAPFKINGHGHRFQAKIKENALSISIPTLSDDIKDDFLPGMVETNILMENKTLKKGIFRHFVIVKNKFIPASNVTFNFQESKGKCHTK